MLFRNLVCTIFGSGVIACFISPAAATELPREGTCHTNSTIEGKVDHAQSSSVGGNAIESWSQTNTTTLNCGGAKWPSIKVRCFGFNEVIGAFRTPTGYCLDTDGDGDEVLWKLVPSKGGANPLVSGGSSEVLMASGKYEGMSGKSTFSCGYYGSSAEWTGSCDGEMTFKFP